MESFSIPSSHIKFNTLQGVVVALLVAKGVSWGVLPATITDAIAKQTAWAAAYTLSTGRTTKSVGNTAARNTLQVTYAAFLKGVFELNLMYNASILPADNIALGIKTVSGTHATIPAPTTVPVVAIGYNASLQQSVKFTNSTTGKKGKPKGVGFLEVWYKIGDPAPVAMTDCINKANIHKWGDVISFNLADKGKMVYYFARWVDTKGQEGPWTLPFSAVII